MPSTATITAFYSFTANTKARSSQVNDNFSIFRGHLLPIDPNTQTAINNTYDLGSSEYYFRTGYIKTLYQAPTDATTSAAVNGFAASPRAVAAFSGSAGAFHIANSTCTIITVGRPIMAKFFGSSILGAYIGGGQKNTTVQIGLIRDGVTISSSVIAISDTNLSYPIDGMGTFDFPAAGSHVYSAYGRSVAFTATSSFSYDLRVAAIEL